MTDPSRSTPKADVSTGGASADAGNAASQVQRSPPSAPEAAHRQYNAALTNLDLPVQAPPEWPAPPARPDDSQVARFNHARNSRPAGALPTGTGIRGRLAACIWPMIRPALQEQLGFKAAIVDHPNRSMRDQAETQQTLAEMMSSLRQRFDGLV